MNNIVKRFVLDVNVIMDLLLATGPIDSLNDILDVTLAGKSVNALRVMRGVVQNIVSGAPDYQVHVSAHVWSTLEHKLLHPTMVHGRPVYNAWSSLDVHNTLSLLQGAIGSMASFGWSVNADSGLSRQELRTLVPAYMIQDKRYDIDVNDDCRVIADAVSIAARTEGNNAPVVTIVVTNDGGLQLANEWLGQNYQSSNASRLPVSFSVMYPKQVASSMEKSRSKVRS